MVTIDPQLINTLLQIAAVVLTAFLAISRYTGNLKLQIRDLRHENVLLRKDTGSVFRQQKYAIKLLEGRIEDMEARLAIEMRFQPREQVKYETHAPWLEDSSPDEK